MMNESYYESYFYQEALKFLDEKCARDSDTAIATDLIWRLSQYAHAIAKHNGYHTETQAPSTTLALIHSEVSEVLQEIRKIGDMPQFMDNTDDDELREKVAEEMADIVMRVMDASAAWGLDLGFAIAEKMKKNAHMPERLKKKF